MNENVKKSPCDSKEFRGSIKRLIKELSVFKKMIVISIIFALIGTILSVIAPNMLSSLSDEIGKELIIEHDTLDYLIEKTDKNEITEEIEIEGVTISVEEQIEFKEIIDSIDDTSSDMKIYSKIDKMPKSIQEVVMPDMDMGKIKQMTFTLVIVYIVSAICMYVQAENMADVTNDFAQNLRSRISRKINLLPFKYFDKHSYGDILSRTTNDVDTIAQSMNQSFENLFSSIILVIGTVIMMFVTNWIMAITAVVATIMGIVLTGKILNKSQKYFISRQKELGELNNHIEETYSNIKIIRANNGKKQTLDKFEKLNQKVYQANKKSQFLSGMMQPIMDFVGNFGYVAVCIVGAILTMNDITTFGVIIAFIAYVELFTSSFVQIAQSTTFIQSTAAASYRVFEFLDEKEDVDEKKIARILKKEDTKGQIEFCNVNFIYNKMQALKNITTKIEAGKKVAIVGTIGSGKTTLMELLLKFYEVDSGEIKIDGISLKELKRENIHRLCTLVFQEPWVFNGTIKENIIFNRKNVSKKLLDEVCEELGLNEFINELPKRYNTKISDKDNISLGEKQLINIARGILEDAPILILDEATSNLDIETEKHVRDAIYKLAKSKTIIVISHRLTTIKDMDSIILMNNGEIIEQGTHDELIKLNGEYARLYNLQVKN